MAQDSHTGQAESAGMRNSFSCEVLTEGLDSTVFLSMLRFDDTMDEGSE